MAIPVAAVADRGRSPSPPRAEEVHRYYDPATGEFLSVDPLVDQTMEPYVYTGDNPVNYEDQSGQIRIGNGDELCDPAIPSECILPTTGQQQCEWVLQANGLDPFTQGYCNPPDPPCVGNWCPQFNPLQGLEGGINWVTGFLGLGQGFKGSPELNCSYTLGQYSNIVLAAVGDGGDDSGRLPQDQGVNPIAPEANNGSSIIGTNLNQAAQLQVDLEYAYSHDAGDIRVNQQQVNAQGVRVGINRPDLQYTINGVRYYIEYDQSVASSVAHEQRILANDPRGVFEGKIIK